MLNSSRPNCFQTGCHHDWSPPDLFAEASSDLSDLPDDLSEVVPEDLLSDSPFALSCSFCAASSCCCFSCFFDQSRMRFRLAVRVEGNALRKLFLPAWRQFARLHMGVGDGVRQLEAEQACAARLGKSPLRRWSCADVVLGLAPTVGCERAARQSQQYHDGDDDGDHTVASGARALRFALLDMLVADGFGDFRIVRIG